MAIGTKKVYKVFHHVMSQVKNTEQKFQTNISGGLYMVFPAELQQRMAICWEEGELLDDCKKSAMVQAMSMFDRLTTHLIRDASEKVDLCTRLEDARNVGNTQTKHLLQTYSDYIFYSKGVKIIGDPTEFSYEPLPTGAIHDITPLMDKWRKTQKNVEVIAKEQAKYKNDLMLDLRNNAGLNNIM